MLETVGVQGPKKRWLCSQVKLFDNIQRKLRLFTELFNLLFTVIMTIFVIIVDIRSVKYASLTNILCRVDQAKMTPKIKLFVEGYPI